MPSLALSLEFSCSGHGTASMVNTEVRNNEPEFVVTVPQHLTLQLHHRDA